MGRAAHLRHTHGLLIVNPRSGKAEPETSALAREARRRGLAIHVLGDAVFRRLFLILLAAGSAQGIAMAAAG